MVGVGMSQMTKGYCSVHYLVWHDKWIKKLYGLDVEIKAEEVS